MHTFDTIIVGGRCAGSSLALLLARRGQRVLVVDRASFPSDTVSGHTIQPGGVARLNRWGLEDLVKQAGGPLIDTYRFDVGGIVLEGTPFPVDGNSFATAPRRSFLDHLLLEAARDAGAEVRTGFTVRELLVDNNRDNGRVVGVSGTDHTGNHELGCRTVVGADGRNSLVARAVAAETYNEIPATTVCLYSYFEGLDCSAIELYPRPNRFTVVVPTNNDQVIIAQEIAVHLAATVRADVAGAFNDALADVPELAERVATCRRTERFRLYTETDAFMRVPNGPGWALVGDAGYHKDPITAQGMLDAFRDVETLADALTADCDIDESLHGYHARRDSHAAEMYDYTAGLARVHEPPPEHVLQLIGALQGNAEQISRYFGIIAGSVPVSEFFSPANLDAIMRGSMATA